jgi:hypothetical protein
MIKWIRNAIMSIGLNYDVESWQVVCYYIQCWILMSWTLLLMLNNDEMMLLYDVK